MDETGTFCVKSCDKYQKRGESYQCVARCPADSAKLRRNGALGDVAGLECSSKCEGIHPYELPDLAKNVTTCEPECKGERKYLNKERKRCISACAFTDQFNQCIDRADCTNEHRLLGDGRCLPKCSFGQF